MEIIQTDYFAILCTEKEFVLAIHKEMAGPFPRTREMFDAVLDLFEHPDDKKAETRVLELKRKHVRSKR
jgi:hypothetical protein